MPTNQFFGVDLKQFVATHKSKTDSLYYQPIQRTGDLLKTASILANNGSSKLIPEFFIAPSRIKIGILPTRALNKLEKELHLKELPDQADIVGLELYQLIKKYGTSKPDSENLLKVDLQQSGFTAEIIQAAKNLNQSRLEPCDREILSRSNIAMYTYYRAIKGLNVEDVQGIISNVYASLTKIKHHLNKVLVDMVLDEQNLNATPEERSILKKDMADIKLTYRQGEAEQLVIEKFQQLKSGGELVTAINEFLDSGLIKVPLYIDRETLVQNMTDYLIESGFSPKALGINDSDAEFDLGQYLVKGTIKDSAGKALSGLRVMAVDQDFSGKNPLGKETRTDKQGKYEIRYREEDFIVEGKESGGADIIIYLLDGQGNIIYQSEPHPNSLKKQVIDLQIEQAFISTHGNDDGSQPPPDDFTMLKGITTETAQALHKHHIKTFDDLEKADENQIQSILDRELAGSKGPNFKIWRWQEQAHLTRGKLKKKLKELQDQLPLTLTDMESNS